MKFFLVVIVAALTTSLSFVSVVTAVNIPPISWTRITNEEAIGVDWSPDGVYIVFANLDTNQIVLMNWRTREILWRVLPPAQKSIDRSSFFARWSPDSRFIAATVMGSLYIVDASSGGFRLLWESNAASANGFSSMETIGYRHPRWSPDSREVAALNWAGYIDIFSVEMSEIIQSIDIQGEFHVGGFRYTGFDWSPNGLIFASPRPVHRAPDEAGIREPDQIGFWDRGGNLLTAYVQQTPTSPLCASDYDESLLGGNDDVAWANDSRTLAAAGQWGYGICRLNIDGTVDNHLISYDAMSTLRWSPDQRWLVSALNSSPGLWAADAANNYQTTELGFESEMGAIFSLAWSPDSQHLAAATNRGVWIGMFASD